MNRLLDLLVTVRQEGYPTDYLLARLRARTESFAGRCPSGRGEEAWLELQKEYGWIFRQMNIGLRTELAPVFFYFELRNLFAALRFCAGADRDGLQTTLSASLLRSQVQIILKKDHTFPATLKELGNLLGRYGENFSRLEEVWRIGGLRSVETSILGGFFGIVQREKPPRAVRDFLRRLLERHNLLQLAKEQRWQLADSLLTADHPALVRRRLKHSLAELSRKDPGIVDDPSLLDTLLVRTLLRDCRRQARSSRTLAMFLAYLCSCWLTARDCGVRGLAHLLSEAQIETELVI
jgi:hypothetical protein